TPLAAMVELDLGNSGRVERSSIHRPCSLKQFAFGDKDELRVWINEPPNYPGTGYAIHFDVTSCNPLHDRSPFTFTSGHLWLSQFDVIEYSSLVIYITMYLDRLHAETQCGSPQSHDGDPSDALTVNPVQLRCASTRPSGTAIALGEDD